MSIRTRRAVLSASVAAVAALAGCSSSGGGEPSPTTGSAGGGICERVSPGKGVPSGSSATKAVEHVYSLFFSTATSFAKSMAVLQHGEELCPALVEVNKTSYGKQKTSATVASVRLTKPNLAVVTFTIRVAGQVVLPDSKGYAVLEDGEWKVAANTFCQLLTLQGSAPDECKDKSFTALPH
jgi:hypothetical protein